MKRFSSFEVRTPITIEQPEDFHSAVAAIGEKIFTGVRSRETIRMWSSGELVVPKSNIFKVFGIDRMNYIHFKRTSDKSGMNPLLYLSLARRVDPKLMDSEAIGGIDLPAEIADRLKTKNQISSLQGTRFILNQLVDVALPEYPEERVFGLSYDALFDESDYEQGFLETISEVVRNRVSLLSKEVYDQKNETRNHPAVEGIVPFARVKAFDEEQIHEFRETFTNNILDPYVIVVAHEIDIDTRL